MINLILLPCFPHLLGIVLLSTRQFVSWDHSQGRQAWATLFLNSYFDQSSRRNRNFADCLCSLFVIMNFEKMLKIEKVPALSGSCPSPGTFSVGLFQGSMSDTPLVKFCIGPCKGLVCDHSRQRCEIYSKVRACGSARRPF
jgi:hypothetical protein